VEQFVELLAGALANRAEAAKKAAAQAQPGAPPPVKGQAGRPAPATPVRRTSPAPAPPVARPAVAPPRSPAAFDGGSDDFGSVFETTSVAEVAAGPRSPLLAAFAGGGGLLAGLILSEALAPPVALCPHRTER
jgi:hypothetical protein